MGVIDIPHDPDTLMIALVLLMFGAPLFWAAVVGIVTVWRDAKHAQLTAPLRKENERLHAENTLLKRRLLHVEQPTAGDGPYRNINKLHE